MPNFPTLQLMEMRPCHPSPSRLILVFPLLSTNNLLATWKMIASSKQRSGFHYMSPMQRTSISCQVSQPSNLWQMLLGHPSPSCLILVSPQLSSNNLSFDSNCGVCPLAKQTRLPFPLSSISTHVAFDLLHRDIFFFLLKKKSHACKIPMHSESRSFLTVVDVFY